MTRLEKMFVDFDGVRKVLRIRSKKKILAAIDTAYKTGDCPLSALTEQATQKQQEKLFTLAEKEQDDKWYSDWSYSFSPYADEMAPWWEASSPCMNRRYLTMLRRMYE